MRISHHAQKLPCVLPLNRGRVLSKWNFKLRVISANIYSINKSYTDLHPTYLIGLLPTCMPRIALPTSHAIRSVQSLPSIASTANLVNAASSCGPFRLETSGAGVSILGRNSTALMKMTAIPTKPAIATNNGSTTNFLFGSTIIFSPGLWTGRIAFIVLSNRLSSMVLSGL